MTQAKPQTGVYWAPLIVVLVIGLVMLLGNLVQSSPSTSDQQRIEQIEAGEEFHCQMYGEPSEEAQLAGYVCP